MTEENCHSSHSRLEGDILLSDHAVKEHQRENLMVLPCLDRLCMKNGSPESITDTLLSDSRHNNQETDNEQNVESESTGTGRYG